MILNPLAVGVTYPSTPFRLRIGDDGISEYEIINVTSRIDDTLQITRDAEGTGAFDYLAGTTVVQVFTAGHWTEMKDAIEASTVTQNSLLTALYAVAGNEDGIIRNSDDTSLLVKESAVPDLNVVLSDGLGFINGELYQNLADLTLTLDAPPATVGEERYDLVYLDYNNKTVEVLKGTEATAPVVVPSVSSPDIPIAQIHVENGDTTIVDADITDTREFI